MVRDAHRSHPASKPTVCATGLVGSPRDVIAFVASIPLLEEVSVEVLSPGPPSLPTGPTLNAPGSPLLVCDEEAWTGIQELAIALTLTL